MNVTQIHAWIRRIVIALAVCSFSILTRNSARAEDGGAANSNWGLALSVDDGSPSWRTVAAPYLAQYGGVATAYVNNQSIKMGKVTFAELKELQDRYGWEIGTHTYHHFDSRDYVRKFSREKWVAEELRQSLDEFRAIGLHVENLAFPFNRVDASLEKVIAPYVHSYRKSDRALAGPDPAPDWIPGQEWGTRANRPVEQIIGWLDIARRRGDVVFLYGHDILPDEHFHSGTIEAVSATTLTDSRADFSQHDKGALCVVADRQRAGTDVTFRVREIQPHAITVSSESLEAVTRAGRNYLVGPCNGVSESEFRRVVDYVAKNSGTFFTTRSFLKNRVRRK